MEKNNKFSLLDGTTLKLIAMISMVFDHVGDNFFPDQVWMRVIGRIAMPIFAFCLAEGFAHTRSRSRYIRRMALFALISEIPFDLVTSGKILEFSRQSIMFTFLWASLTLTAYEKILSGERSRKKTILSIGLLLVSLVLSLVFGMDYDILAVGLVCIFYLFRKKTLAVRNVCAMVYHVLLRNVGIYWFGLLGFLPIFLYNGKKGRGLKWLFYIFYPGHLLLIYIIRTLLKA